MSQESIFGEDFPHTYQPQYVPVPRQSELEKEQLRLGELIRDIGMDAKIVRTQDGFVFGFKNFDDSTRFISVAFGVRDNPEAFKHTETFENCHPLFVKVWGDVVRDYACNNGIPCRVVTGPSTVTIYLDTIEDQGRIFSASENHIFDAPAVARFGAMHGQPDLQIEPS